MPKPLYFFLAKHGPWDLSVRLRSVDDLESAEHWLLSKGKKFNTDYEVLSPCISPHVSTQQGDQVILPIMFMNDPKLATYIKLTWG